ncbi:MAG: DUF7017 domain-containing protein [Candidatus Saccharimonadaceae bacterium]
MPSKEIKELRQSGKLDEAHAMAKAELDAAPDDIWAKRNMSWVLYSQMDKSVGELSIFTGKLNELKALNLPATEEMLFDNISIVIAKAVRQITSKDPINYTQVRLLFENIKILPLIKPSKWYSVLFQAFHKAFKETDSYTEFADWWDFSNFMPEDYQKDKMPDGKEVMAIAEQGYIAYAKHILPKQTQHGEVIFYREKAEEFLPLLVQIAEKYPHFQYPAYFQAKLLLALGDREDILAALLPFAKKKKNDFWVWEIMSEAFSHDEDKVFAFYCKALSCHSPEEMLISLRQKMAALFIKRQMFNEARTEIDLLLAARNAKNYRIPTEVIQWQSQEWYKAAITSRNNMSQYAKYADFADEFLFGDVPEETVIVEFVNSDRKILNFIASENKHGFFKYERFLKNVAIGDILKVRFQSGTNEGLYLVHTAIKATDDDFRNQFFKEVEGDVRIGDGKSFGFLKDIFIHPSIVTKHKLVNGTYLKGHAIKTYNSEKKQWGWKILEIQLTLNKDEALDICPLINKIKGSFKEVILKAISVYFPFTIDQVIQYQNKLFWGDCTNGDVSMFASVNYYKIGLIFNAHLDWNDERLKSFNKNQALQQENLSMEQTDPSSYHEDNFLAVIDDVLFGYSHGIYDTELGFFYDSGFDDENIPKDIWDLYKSRLQDRNNAILRKYKPYLSESMDLLSFIKFLANHNITDLDILTNPQLWEGALSKYVTSDNLSEILDLYDGAYLNSLIDKTEYMSIEKCWE